MRPKRDNSSICFTVIVFFRYLVLFSIISRSSHNCLNSFLQKPTPNSCIKFSEYIYHFFDIVNLFLSLSWNIIVFVEINCPLPVLIIYLSLKFCRVHAECSTYSHLSHNRTIVWSPDQFLCHRSFVIFRTTCNQASGTGLCC